MVDDGEELEPLFDYHRVQPMNFVCIDDDELDSPVKPAPKRAKASETVVEKADEDVKVITVAVDEDWLPPPPKVISNGGDLSGEDSTIKALRLKRQELLSFTKTAEDVMREVETSSRRKVDLFSDPSSEVAGKTLQEPQNGRVKIVIKIQDKDGPQQYRVYADEKFERLFKMYADRAKLNPQNLVFCFDGDKIDPTTTPDTLGLEDDDMIEVHTVKS
ncbi:PREDICTED: uncharacterized protein LOC104801669 isoform X2 [Tarenaya hassleriana]|uniref:uncharacterized protein LOC104801669 isoform X2 n=1 Tax=Tarenaya hassleriana TaxID=28532 RepID=UPI00053C31EF|nr:PREDICTED: uncharacterized protein LOC104801669 isoform X2 [Tarenaya hassleriana]